MADLKVRDIFLTFLKIGVFGFGGAYSILALFERELVHKRKWITEEEFAESVMIGQLTPGAYIVNTGIFIGYTLKRLRGALATVVGQILPSFCLVLLLSYLYVEYNKFPGLSAMLKGIGAAVVGLIGSIIYNMSRTVLRDYRGILISLFAFLCLAVLKWNPVGLILLAGLAGVLIYGKGNENGDL